MARPTLHSITWSDGWKEDCVGFIPEEMAPCFPLQLEDSELRCWVSYPDKRSGKAKRKKNGKSSRRKPKLWAVLIIEEVRQADPFAFEVALRRIYKKGDRVFRVWVKNDPNDQSDDANVFSFISPQPEQLDSLEQHLIDMAAKRVYYAIADTWPLCQNQDSTEMPSSARPGRSVK
ncbi:MAG: hypothetical protein HQ581_07425 [Planctomycetes bacterium]|nr:hypothetical protein [Planctomycetota bacterium]